VQGACLHVSLAFVRVPLDRVLFVLLLEPLALLLLAHLPHEHRTRDRQRPAGIVRCSNVQASTRTSRAAERSRLQLREGPIAHAHAQRAVSREPSAACAAAGGQHAGCGPWRLGIVGCGAALAAVARRRSKEGPRTSGRLAGSSSTARWSRPLPCDGWPHLPASPSRSRVLPLGQRYHADRDNHVGRLG
jgi:hypothetical protein